MKIFRLIILILHLGILFLLLGSLLNAYVPPRIFPWFNLLSLGFPILMIVYILMTVFWIFSWKKRAFVFMLVGLIFINPVKRIINFSSDKKEKAAIKIVSFNVKGGIMGKEEIGKYLKSQEADVILLQEGRGGDFPYLEEYKRVNFSGVGTILTQHKVLNTKELDFPEKSEIPPAVQADIEIKGKVYRFIDVYLHPFKFEREMVTLNGNSDANEQKMKDIVKRLIPTFKIHQKQIELIKNAVESSPYPVILAGDFNSVPNSYEYYHLSSGLEDAFLSAGKGSATSFHDYKFPIRIDYIFSSPSVKAVSYVVDRSVSFSDHYPVISEFSSDSK
ncbi:endonuclease/exonuclease/phosphatase (EEP) superfamily protein YafD [Chryseobacterium rhizosphaerae]|uniref:endonuclease/exonuclease/phosphatase family protein n=1 Tax=Chryseobacterium rhizosphaerae TaxID=395937 RepID=UPI00285BEBB9|nr:endonuclease/exonuclease/phosphatase family protein [Chryseobacterium rhizosphaerae]MDR6546131.1 endonuclease/exonuclease/phosphatase (EEP) superfamily protein YafD [Chryseobacterium rhizosphaerae]